MALKKELVTNNVTASYWRIVGYTVSITGKLVQIFLVGYNNEITREKKMDISSRNYMITKENFDKYISVVEGVHTADLYGFLKSEVEEFKDSTDI